MSMPMVLFKSLSDDALIPQRYSVYAAGFDLHALDGGFVYPGEVAVVRTGIAADIPLGYEGQVRSRSGQTLRGLVVANAPGTVDADYRGEVCVLVTSIVKHAVRWGAGERIAQLVIAPIARVQGMETTCKLTQTPRGRSGFGSTGR